MSSPYDLCALADVKAWLGLTSTTDDALLGSLITEVGRAVLANLDRPTVLPSPIAETRDGGNETSILLRHWPVIGVTSCSVDGMAVSAAAPLVAGAAPQQGYILDVAEAQPPGRMQRLSLRGTSFNIGVQNVVIAYLSGYQVAGETAQVPATSPYVVTAAAPYGAWASDGGVSYAGGPSLTPVAAVPRAGQYTVAAGVYTLANADAGAQLVFTYGYVPADLAQACREWVAERYAYRGRIGQRSKSLGGQETLSYIVKDVPDFVASALQPYRRVVSP